MTPQEAAIVRDSCCVYVMYVDEREDVAKIGLSQHPHKRARELGRSVRVLYSRKFESRQLARRVEQRLHAYFAAYRIPGTEWFWIDPDEGQRRLASVEYL